jgi:hypothetical protein
MVATSLNNTKQHTGNWVVNLNGTVGSNQNVAVELVDSGIIGASQSGLHGRKRITSRTWRLQMTFVAHVLIPQVLSLLLLLLAGWVQKIYHLRNDINVSSSWLRSNNCTVQQRIGGIDTGVQRRANDANISVNRCTEIVPDTVVGVGARSARHQRGDGGAVALEQRASSGS